MTRLVSGSWVEYKVSLMCYFTGRKPAGPYRIAVPTRQTLHVRLNDLEDHESILKETDFAYTARSNVPIVVQHARLDSKQSKNALMTTMGYWSD